MAKFCGKIGFAETVEDPPDSGIAVSVVTERTYYGDILRRNVVNETQGVVNPSLNINNEISIVADQYILNNIANMRYITYLGTKWDLRTISIDFPRMNITLGGLYNGPVPSGIKKANSAQQTKKSSSKTSMVSKSRKSKLEYPCIMYNWERIRNLFADNGSYHSRRGYSVTLIDYRPDSPLPEMLQKELPTASFDRHYVADGLNHWVYTIFF